MVKSQTEVFNEMQETYIYELVDITFENPYPQIEDEGYYFVREDEPTRLEEKPELAIEYDAEGIPMGSSRNEMLIRREKIHQYIQQWRIDHAETPYIYNKDLNENVKINQLFLLESVAHSAYRYQSTKAVLGMEEVITEAKYVCKVKAKGNSNQKPFNEMMILRYHSSILGTVKMTVGIRKRTIEKVQYSITVPVPEIPFVDESSIIREKSKNKKRKKHP